MSTNEQFAAQKRLEDMVRAQAKKDPMGAARRAREIANGFYSVSQKITRDAERYGGGA
jgi:hypothetical protein